MAQVPKSVGQLVDPGASSPDPRSAEEARNAMGAAEEAAVDTLAGDLDTLSGAVDTLGDDLDATASALSSHAGNTSNPHGVTKSQVGLSNVDNTSDAAKPVSDATAAALAGKLATDGDGSQVTALNASNLSSGTVPIARLGASGTRDATTVLRGDNTFGTPPAAATPARIVAALDLDRVIVWDDGKSSGPVGTSPSGHAWGRHLISGPAPDITRGPNGFRANTNSTSTGHEAVTLDGLTTGPGVQISFTTRRIVQSRNHGVILSFIDASNWLEVIMDGSTLRVRECVAGTVSVLGSATAFGSNIPNVSTRITAMIVGADQSAFRTVTAYTDFSPNNVVRVTPTQNWTTGRPGFSFNLTSNTDMAYVTAFVLRDTN